VGPPPAPRGLAKGKKKASGNGSKAAAPEPEPEEAEAPSGSEIAPRRPAPAQQRPDLLRDGLRAAFGVARWTRRRLLG
jgi:hypothetical protein